MADIEILQKKAEAWGVNCILDMASVPANALKDTDVVKLLESRPNCAVLENGMVLISEVDRQSYQRAKTFIETLKADKKIIEGVVIPADSKVIHLLRSRMLSSNQVDTQSNIVEIKERSKTQEQQMLYALIDAAKKAGSSDVHILTDSDSGEAEIFFKLNNALEQQTQTALQLSHMEAVALGSVIVNWEAHTSGGSSQKGFDGNVPIRGSCTVDTQNGKTTIRYSHVPTSGPRGIRIVLRVTAADGEGKIPTFCVLGYNAFEQELLRKLFMSDRGIVLFVGPTGAGKSTTMAAGVGLIPKSKNIISLEDPIENALPNVSQIQVNDRNPDMTYAALAREILRQDPDVMLFGEINDKEVAKEVVQAANTGHFIISTLHANSAPEAIQRLNNLGCSWQDLALPSLLRGIIGQRLVPQLCDQCKVSIEEIEDTAWITEDHRRIKKHFEQTFGTSAKGVFFRNMGPSSCTGCRGKGEVRRMPIVEILVLDERSRHYIAVADFKGWKNYLASKKWTSMSDDGINKVLKGGICPLSVEHYIDIDFGVNYDEFNYDEVRQNIELSRHGMVSEPAKKIVEIGV